MGMKRYEEVKRPFSYKSEQFYFGEKEIRIMVPDAGEVKAKYLSHLDNEPGIPFPFWTKIWPSSKALAAFIGEYPHLIKDKHVLEIGAGLSLPSLLAAQYAKKVTCTDYLPEAITAMKMSVKTNAFQNVECRLVDWRSAPELPEADVLLASDINYDPMQFDEVYRFLKNMINKGKTVLLSTPERLQSRLFIEKLEGWIRYAKNYSFEEKSQIVVVTVLELREEEND